MKLALFLTRRLAARFETKQQQTNMTRSDLALTLSCRQHFRFEFPGYSEVDRKTRRTENSAERVPERAQ